MANAKLKATTEPNLMPSRRAVLIGATAALATGAATTLALADAGVATSPAHAEIDAPIAKRSRDLDADEILAYCRTGGVPANCNVDAAIAAHQRAFASFTANPGTAEREFAGYVLRAVVLAAAMTRHGAETRLAYMAALPSEAWDLIEHLSAAEVRRDTLAIFRRECDRKAA